LKFLNFKAIYILWLRDMKIFTRAKSRVFGTVITPLFFLAFLSLGFSKATIPGISNYTPYLVPGMVGISMIYSSTFAGVSVLWDKQFGFLKEIMVTPVDRVSIVMGRILGGMTTSVIQGLAILIIATLFGFFNFSPLSLLPALAFMIMIAASFIGLGLAIASRLKDIQGFGIIMNFITLPMVFLSNAIYTTSSFPTIIRYLTYINPLNFGVDGMRGSLINVTVYSVPVDFGIMLVFCTAMIILGAILFEKSDYS
jgi:ABC-2 type transport system permease protein